MADLKKQNWFTEGVILALMPVVSYAIAFTYEAGFFEHFDIPLHLIHIGVTEIVVAFFSLLITILTFYLFAELVRPFWVRLPEKIRPRLNLYMFFLFAIATHVLIAHGNPDGLQYILIVVAVMAFVDFVVPALSRKDPRAYVDRIAHIHEKDLAYDAVMDKIGYAIGFNWFLIIVASLLLVFHSYSTGVGKARTQKDYQVLSNSRSTVILRMYADKLILTEFDEAEHAISKVISVWSGDKKYSFLKRGIGPLHLPEEKKELDTQPTQSNTALQPTAKGGS